MEEDAEGEAAPEPTLVLSAEETPMPFLKFFHVKIIDEDLPAVDTERGVESDTMEATRRGRMSSGRRGVRYYNPKLGDFVADVVV
jgi:small subunit ribosomal protein S1